MGWEVREVREDRGAALDGVDGVASLDRSADA